MDVEDKIGVAPPSIVIWYGRAIQFLGALLLALGIIALIIAAVVGLFLAEWGNSFGALMALSDLWGIGLGIFAYGTGVASGKRWHLFGLLIFIFFGSFVIGIFSMAGRETNVGYYIWAIGGAISLSLLLILVVYWEQLLDG